MGESYRIGFYEDGLLYYLIVSIISLGFYIVLDFYELWWLEDDDFIEEFWFLFWFIILLLLELCSLLVFCGFVYMCFFYGIVVVCVDVLDVVFLLFNVVVCLLVWFGVCLVCGIWVLLIICCVFCVLCVGFLLGK